MGEEKRMREGGARGESESPLLSVDPLFTFWVRYSESAGRVRGSCMLRVGGCAPAEKVVRWRRRWPWRDLGSGCAGG